MHTRSTHPPHPYQPPALLVSQNMMADDDSMLHINLQDVKNEIDEDTAIDELFELLELMQEEWKADTATSHNQLEELRSNNETLQLDIDILRNENNKYKQRIKELEDQHRKTVEQLKMKNTEISHYKGRVNLLEDEQKSNHQEYRPLGRNSETSTSGHRGLERRK